jgi:ketosteroid isomerase-like protein
MGTREEIERLTAQFATAVTNKNFGALGLFYEERARFLPPGGPMAEGPAAIQAAQQKIIEGGVQTLDLRAIDVIEAGDFVIEIGQITVTIQPAGIKSLFVLLMMGKRRLTIHGKSIVIWHRQKDGTLKIVADTFNHSGSPV